MTPDRLRAALQIGVLALLLLPPLPYGSVQAGPVLAIELTAAALGLMTILLIGRDRAATAAVPKLPLAICGGVIALGILQIVPLPFSIAAKFNPTADLVRPLIPYLGLDHPPPVTWSVASPETTDALLRFIAYVLIGLAAAVAFDTERSRRRFALVLVTAAVFQAVYGSGEYLTGRQHIFGFAKKYYLDSATGTFINRNHFATMLAIALPFALVLAFSETASSRKQLAISWRRRLVAAADAGGLERLLAVAASALIWLGLLLSHSRAGLAAALVGGSIVLVRFRTRRAAHWAGALGAGLLLTLLTIETTQAPGERFLTLREDILDKAGRPAVWRDAVALLGARPVIGWGLGTFESVFPTVQSADIELHYDHAHSDWLEWTTEGGVLALGVAIALLGAALRNTWRTTRATSGTAALPIACCAAVAAAAVHAAWDFSLRIPAVAVLGAILMGLALTRRSSDTPARVTASAFNGSLAGRVSGDRTVPRAALAMAAILICSAAALAVSSHQAGWNATAPRADGSALVWLGPKGPALETAIDASLKAALVALDDPNRDTASRLPDYQTELQRARPLLRRAILANLADTRAIQRLAAVEWELSVLNGTPDEHSVAALVGVAGARAPRVSEIQIELGEIFYKLGRFDDAEPFMARAVSLSAAAANRVVGIMSGAGVEPSEVLRTLPPAPEVLVALMPEFLSQGRGEEFLSVLEERMGVGSAPLLATYGNLAMSLRQADRLRSHLSDLGKLADANAEAERQFQLGRASAFAEEWDAAYGFASAALALWPTDPRYCEFAAAIAIKSDHLSEAEIILRDGLSRLASLDGTRAWRARLYRGLGEVYERMGKGDEGLVFYRRALQQDPTESVARAKVAQVEALVAPKDAQHP